MTVRIVVAGPSDVDALADLAARTFPLACPAGSSESDIAETIATMLSVDRFVGYVADPERTILVARGDDGSMLGYAMFVSAEVTDHDVRAALTVQPSLEVSKMYVDLQAHGTGTSAALMQSGEELARSSGIGAMWLGVSEHNQRARKFYGKAGFTDVGRKTFMLGSDPQNDYVMQKLLI